MSTDTVVLDGTPLSFQAIRAVAVDGRPVAVAAAALDEVERGRAIIDRLAAGREAIYGVNTGFGSLARFRIDPDDVRAIQRNLIRSHAAGVGDPLPPAVVRAMLLILAASLCRGRSGVRGALITQIAELLNRGLTPVVHSRGSVGASGDLAPLAEAALALIGEGRVWEGERVAEAGAALERAGLAPLTLEAKEGLALINGTHLMTAMGVLALDDLDRIFDAALCATALAVDACRATDATLDERVHVARNQHGQTRVAALLRALLAGSTIVGSHREQDPRVQDPYCVRAAPQVLGAIFDTIEHVRLIFARELGAVTDNPLVFADTDDVLSGANFHGLPLAIALDTLAIAVAHLAGIAERRIDWLLRASDSENPVNLYLSPNPGLHSGLMIAQYTAAACCNELQTLATPASVANIPTSAGIEDYNSMGITSAHQLHGAVRLARSVVAIELLVMTEALEYQRPLVSGRGVEATFAAVRARVPRLIEDRPPSPDIAEIETLIDFGVFGPIARGDA